MAEHCVVVGAGIVGSCCAWHLRRKGFAVTLVDPLPPGGAASSGNAACIAASGVVPFSYPGVVRKLPRWLGDPLGPVAVRPRALPSLTPWFWRAWRAGTMQKVEAIARAQATLMRSVLADYDDILAATGGAHFKVSRGAIHVYDSEAQYREDAWQAELRERLGFGQRRLSAGELKSMAPCLRLGDGVAFHVPHWHNLRDPERVTRHIAEHCFAEGGQWVQDRVKSVSAAPGGVEVRTRGGRRIAADRLVVAAGAWSNELAAQLDRKVPLAAERGYHCMIGDPGVQLDYPVMSVNRHFVMTPLEGGLRVAGTAEFAALDAPPDHRRSKALLQLAGRYLDGLRANGVTEWMGPRPATPDSLPVISLSPGHGNVYYAFGHGHYGLTQGPTTGRLIGQLVAGETPSTDLSPFGFERFWKR